MVSRRQRTQGSSAERMVVLQRAAAEPTPTPVVPPAQFPPTGETTTPREVAVDPYRIARRVYDLLREDLTVGRARRGRRI